MESTRTWIETNRVLIAFFFLYLIHASTLGLSDDEAYYWVLAQKPSLSYAFHPPMVAWWIAFSEAILKPFFGTTSVALVRLPAVFGTTLILYMALEWLRGLGISRQFELRLFCVMLSFFGFFSLSWMMVPDIPLFVGWTIVFTSTWSICFNEESNRDLWRLAAGAFIAMLSKYSAILVLASALLTLLIWSRGRRLKRGLLGLGLGAVSAAVPIVVWNAQHQWTSILYQIHERHQGGEISWVRYLRFWLTQWILAGPVLVLSSVEVFRRARRDRRFQFIALFAVPGAAVFCLQPLFSDFKLHWAFVVWWPMLLGLGILSVGPEWRWIRIQTLYGLTLSAVVFVACHLPVLSLISWRLAGTTDPKLDVTNDFYGWRNLEASMKEKGLADLRLPVVGSRYQTASQAAFQLVQGSVTLIPRSYRELEEWPNLAVASDAGPDWPELKQPVLYVTDNRYDHPPEFKKAQCEKVGRLEDFRWGYLSKWIELWKCLPL